MLRQESSNRISSDRNGAPPPPSGGAADNPSYGDATRTGSVDIQRELNKLEEMILDSPRIPLSRRTLVDEEQLLDQLDLIRINLPTAFQEAIDVARHKEDILLEAEQYAQEIIETAERRASQILDEMGLMRQAELEVKQIRQQMQQECSEAQEQVLADIERMRRQAQQELDDMQQRALAECEDIQAGADAYADRILGGLEQQLADMMRVIRNGRQQLQPEPTPPAKNPPSSAARPIQSPKPSDRPKS